ncbi:unnamed protein product [Protopolystoma xenopodis]|uniref:Uncharacterized protein n=1 Tax=Protopolystoma xenopodis TaxID=117903 RepID=A0A448WY03_9PLAT|nr:unnamed protein product [Protopolystoma xenopodis]
MRDIPGYNNGHISLFLEPHSSESSFDLRRDLASDFQPGFSVTSSTTTITSCGDLLDSGLHDSGCLGSELHLLLGSVCRDHAGSSDQRSSSLISVGSRESSLTMVSSPPTTLGGASFLSGGGGGSSSGGGSQTGMQAVHLGHPSCLSSVASLTGGSSSGGSGSLAPGGQLIEDGVSGILDTTSFRGRGSSFSDAEAVAVLSESAGYFSVEHTSPADVCQLNGTDSSHANHLNGGTRGMRSSKTNRSRQFMCNSATISSALSLSSTASLPAS